MSTNNHNVVVALSGSGRTLENLLEKQGQFSYRVSGVISSNPKCRGVGIAQKAHLPLLVENFGGKGGQRDQDLRQSLLDFLKQCDAGWVALAGFLKKWPILKGFEKRVLNIHPALLPHFGGPGMYGAKVHQAVLSSGVRESGATIHFVTERYDEGPILAQERVPVFPQDTVEALAQRVFEKECSLYPRALDDLISGKQNL